MKNRVFKALFILETTIILLSALWVGSVIFNGEKTEVFREISPDEKYVLCIQEIGTPDWPFGADHLRITLFENNNDLHYRASFKADVSNDGQRAAYKIDWLKDGVQIALIGSEQPTAYYILPFKTLND